ncbi:hypothetical protein DSO57_1015846 [Entomophthora muscae]|uniref:Uncharacterized protein n=1 Tax=Entomophthora muscae TaxID=34485 RepID=A0ACC2UDY4_9FUNG|nr:hypothetical protein DSO57_1015846 [Entomophthora muscae]
MDSLIFLSFGFAGKTEYASDGSRLEEGSFSEIVEVSWIVANPTSLEILREEQFYCKCQPEIMKAAVREGILSEEKVTELDTGLSGALDALSETFFRLVISKKSQESVGYVWGK